MPPPMMTILAEDGSSLMSGPWFEGRVGGLEALRFSAV